MGCNYCPIEPSDWSDGDEPEEGDECPVCNGSGEVQEVVDSLLICNECPRCDGDGVVFKEPRDYQPEMDDVI